MELSPRSIGEAGPGGGGTQRVRCWKCQTNFLVLRTATRGICPECGSQTALHRLRMPMMPSAEIKAEAESREGVLQSDGEAGFGEEVRDLFGPERAGSSLKGVTVLENGGPGPKPGGGRKRGSSGAERGQCEGRGRMVARWPAYHEGRASRKEGSPDPPMASELVLKLLALAIGVLVVLVLLVVALMLWGG